MTEIDKLSVLCTNKTGIIVNSKCKKEEKTKGHQISGLTCYAYWMNLGVNLNGNITSYLFCFGDIMAGMTDKE